MYKIKLRTLKSFSLFDSVVRRGGGSNTQIHRRRTTGNGKRSGGVGGAHKQTPEKK